MADLDCTEIEALLDGAFIPDERTFMALIPQLLQSIVDAISGGGGITPYSAFTTQTTVDVTSASAVVLTAEVGRRAGSLVAHTENAGSVFVAFGQPAAITFGEIPPGGVYQIPSLYEGTVTAIRVAGAGTFKLDVASW